MRRSLALLVLLLTPILCWAHAGSKSRLTVQVQGTQLDAQLVASVVDVALALKLDIRQAPEILRPLLASRTDELRAYAAQGLVMLVNGERQEVSITGITDATLNEEEVLIVALRATAALRIDALAVGFTMFFEDDVLHECLASIRWDDGARAEFIFRPGEPFQQLQRRSDATPGFLQFVRSGIWHIWTGYDHVLFLIALLLPAVLRRKEGAWVAAPELSAAMLRATAIITAFTLAHSATLISASLGWIRLPGKLVESAIAVSVFVAAGGNLLPRNAGIGGPWMAFAFGLLHGFGFAAVLSTLVPETAEVWRPLLAFNLGVEFGQLAIAAVLLPLAWAMRGTWVYRNVIVKAGSGLICACAALWFCARMF